MKTLPDSRISELRLHRFWLNPDFYHAAFSSTDGERIKIKAPGWYNRGWGPDFKNARVIIGERELFGDIEFHVQEKDWFQHQHHLDPRYNKVILHVFLTAGSRPALNQLQQPISAICLQSHCFPPFEWNVAAARLEKETPGACGLALFQQASQRVVPLIYQAAETRLLKKSGQLESALAKSPESAENLLYTRLARALGYTGHADVFEKIAGQLSYQKIKALLKKDLRQSRIEFLTYWFYLTGVLNTFTVADAPDEVRRDLLAIQQRCQELPHALENECLVWVKKTPTLPANQIFRRLTGLYHHLRYNAYDGLLRSWLKAIYAMTEPSRLTRKKVLAVLEQMFPTPEWEPFAHLFSLRKKSPQRGARLIGPERQRIILINAILPFFVAWARWRKDRELEKKLFSIYLILPAEGENHKTRFMKKRLRIDGQPVFKNRLPLHQGLIQIYDDCCSNFYEGCEKCSFLKILNSRLDHFDEFH